MKTTAIFFLVLYPIILFGQSGLTDPPLSIFYEGEKLLMTHNRPDSALTYSQAILARPKLDLRSKSQALLILGRALFIEESPDASVLPLQQSLSIAKSIKNDLLTLKSLVALGASMTTKEYPRMDSVLIYLEEAKPLAVSLKDTSSLSRIYNNLANVFIDEEDLDKAMAQCYLCESLIKNSRFETEKAFCHNSTGRALYELYFRDEKDEYLKTAVASFQKAAAIFEMLGNKRLEASARLNIGEAAAFLDDYGQAERETKQAMKLGGELKDSTILLEGYYNLANQYEGENRLKESKFALNEMNDLLKKMGTAGDIAFVTDQFSNNELRVSTALVNNRVELLDKKMEIYNSTREKQLLWFMSILLAFIIIGGSLYVYQKNKLTIQKQQIIQDKLENMLKSQQIEFMRARFEGEEEGRHRIARQIHDGVGGLLISAKWNLESALEEISKKETKVAARLSENLRLQEHSYKELRRVVHALEREDIPWWEDLQNLYQQMSERYNTNIRFYTYNLDKRVGGLIGEESRLMVQEVITNALKHAKASEITVQINQIEDTLGIIIEDNGIGFDPEHVIKGMGIKSLEKRSTTLGGSIIFESNKPTGTTVFIDIPIGVPNILRDTSLLYA